MSPKKSPQIEDYIVIAEERWYDNQYVSLAMHVHVRTLSRWRKDGYIQYVKIGRKIYYLESAVVEMKKKYTVKTGKRK
jgi:hypothetical protein